ncbi:ABC transporter ATP-binding protein, partial [bacterium]|nr:ABC transporter ATP-binding protein [bacterium]
SDRVYRSSCFSVFHVSKRSMSMLKVDQLRFSYGSKRVLDGITFSVGAGDFIGIVGPNGSGKTTLLKLLQRLNHPVGGKIEFRDKNLESYSSRELAREIACVAQRPFFAFPFLAEQFVFLGRTPYLNFLKRETSVDRNALKEAMRQTDTLHLAQIPISQLSAGELQRVCIATALAQQPEILLLDEPSSFLDLRQLARLSRLLFRLQNEGATILCASHDLQFLKKHSTRILLLDEGRQIGFGAYEEILSEETLRSLFDVKEEFHAS